MSRHDGDRVIIGVALLERFVQILSLAAWNAESRAREFLRRRISD